MADITLALSKFSELMPDVVVAYPFVNERACKGTVAGLYPAAAKINIQNESQVVLAMKIARTYGVAVHPISTGNNWGYGTENPPSAHCIVLDLSAMRAIAIRAENEDLGVLQIEPGVTQQSLSEFLNAGALPFLVPTTGAGPNCSVLANALERGYGITPLTDHFAAVTSIRAVLADGSIYQSSLDAIGAHKVAGLFKWGFGPYLDGLFSQGHLGIVTQISIALAKKPRVVAMLSFSSRDESSADPLYPLVKITRDVLATYPGVIGSINLMNARRVLGMIAPIPAIDAPNVLSDQTIRELSKRHLVSRWNGVASIYGEPDIVRAAFRGIKRMFAGDTKRVFLVTRSRVALAQSVSRVLPRDLRNRIEGVTNSMSSGLDILAGQPSMVAHRVLYWALRRGFDKNRNLDPAHEGVGLLWFVPLLPARPKEIIEYVQMVERVCRSFEIEPLITLTSISERCFDSSVPIVFDRDNARRAELANRCYAELLEQGLAMGIAPYRFNSAWNNHMIPSDATFNSLLKKIRAATDSDRLISPGRYEN